MCRLNKDVGDEDAISLFTNSNQVPKMILLMGMNTSLMMYPMKPITTKPIAQACKIFMYSFLSGFAHLLKKLTLSLENS